MSPIGVYFELDGVMYIIMNNSAAPLLEVGEGENGLLTRKIAVKPHPTGLASFTILM